MKRNGARDRGGGFGINTQEKLLAQGASWACVWDQPVGLGRKVVQEYLDQDHVVTNGVKECQF